MELLPNVLAAAQPALDPAGQPAAAHLVGRAVPADAIEIDLAAAAKILYGPQPLPIEILDIKRG